MRAGFPAVGLALLLTMGNAAADETPRWSGFYLGAHLGAAWGSADYDEPADPAAGFDTDLGGITGGLLGGYSLRLGDLVLGLEADGGLGDAEQAGDNGYTVLRQAWNTHLRLRAGWAFEELLVYAAGGLAATGLEIDDSDAGFGSDRERLLGWSLGGGLEIAVTPRLLVRVEYLYDDYGQADAFLAAPAGPFFPGYDAEVDLTQHSLRAGFAWQF